MTCFIPETDRSYSFLQNRRLGGSMFSPSALKSQRPEQYEHVSFLTGLRVIPKNRDTDRYSGYQVSAARGRHLGKKCGLITAFLVSNSIALSPMKFLKRQ